VKCAYCDGEMRQEKGAFACTRSACSASSVRWRSCGRCKKPSEVEWQGARLCLNCLDGVTLVACSTCKAYSPVALKTCVTPGCIAAFKASGGPGAQKMGADHCTTCRRPLQPGTLINTWRCESCGLDFKPCGYCARISMRLNAPAMCLAEGCAAHNIEWRTCQVCKQLSVPIVAKSGQVTCLTPGCGTMMTVVECPACGQGYPWAVGACPRPSCELAMKRMETCFFCRRIAREARTGHCHNRACRRFKQGTEACPQCGEWSLVRGPQSTGCANERCRPGQPVPPPPPPPPRAPVESLLDRLAAQSTFEERYEVLGPVHRGGMGEIWRAKDRLIGREVAIKVAQAGLADNTAGREQFLKETRIGGRLLHPNVLPVFDVGVTRDRRLYFTMRFVNGESLRRSLDAVATACSTQLVEFPLTKVVDAFTRVCAGVDFAHQNRVIHLDLKPDNVLVSGFSEVFVIDWGLARVDGLDDLAQLYELYGGDDGDDSTRCGYNEGGRRVIGTPGFMAPEQVEGDPKKFGQPTDVFGLGGILYYMLYGSAPCRPTGMTDFVEILKATMAPQRMGRLREGILPRGQRIAKERAELVASLERIALKCLERDATQRYLRVEDLIVELNETVNRKP